MTIHNSILRPVVDFAASHTEITAIAVAFASSWFLYGVLGKRALGADDDYWEAIRAIVIPLLTKAAQSRGLYVNTRVTNDEYVGFVKMGEDEFERRLQEAGFLRMPLASLHRNPDGWIEDGSWSKAHGYGWPVGKILEVVPIGGPIVRRFLSSLDTILALRQTHIITFTREEGGEQYIHVYSHEEPNPINPLTAFQHYTSVGFRAAPEMARRELETTGIAFQKP